jgi:short-chain fatty acids transporter
MTKHAHTAPSDGLLSRWGAGLADWSERWFPDAFVFALAAVVIVFCGGLAVGAGPIDMAEAFGKGFWSLVPFTMQMAMVIVGGYVVAVSPPVHWLIRQIARIPSTPRGAVAFTALFAMLASLLSWGFSLIFSGLLVKELAARQRRVDFRALAAAAYLGLGSIWALGLSSSAALMMATPESLPAALKDVTGVLPLTRTLFLWQNLVLIVTLLVVSVVVAWLSYPAEARIRTASDLGVRLEPPTVAVDRPTTPGERLETSPFLALAVAALGIAYLVVVFMDKGGMAALDLNTYNLGFLMLGLVLHGRPRSFLRAVSGAIPATGGVLVQFPFYGGVFGILTGTALSATLAGAFTAVTTRDTFPLFTAAYSAVLGMFVPSGGGKWVIEAPYLMTAANAHGVDAGWVVQIYNAAEALPNLINPFWMLPLMGLLNVRARELAGFSILQLMVHTPVVFLLCWALSYTF